MLKLLKLYVSDYFKKLIITFIISIAAGVILFYPLAENITEQILFTNWALYIAMYGVFFYHFPLTNIVKWSVNLPLQKKDLIIFNLLYQLIKLIATLGCICFAFWAEYQIFNDNIYVGQLNDNVQILKEYTLNRDLVAVSRGFLPAMKLMILILSMSFFFTFIFNVAPYGPFKNKLITFRDSINFLKYKIKTFGHKDLIFLLAFCVLISLTPYLYSKAAIAGFFVTSMLCILYFTYEKALIFSKKTRFYCVSFSVFVGLYTCLGLTNYSKTILLRSDLTIMDKIEEWEFLNIDHFGNKPVKRLSSYLSGANLCDRDIKKIFFYFRKKHHIAVNSVFKSPNAFKNIILSKGQCGLKSISKTIAPHMMTAKMFIQYFDKWKETSLSYSPRKYLQIVRPFLKRELTKSEIITLIESQNPLAQFFVLEKLKNNSEHLTYQELEKLTPLFKEEALLALKSFAKKYFCQSYSISEIQMGKMLLKNQCHRQRQISSILEKTIL
jgi:hypothetical protein